MDTASAEHTSAECSIAVLAALLLKDSPVISESLRQAVKELDSDIRAAHGDQHHTVSAMLDGVAVFANMAAAMPGMTHASVAANLRPSVLPLDYSLKLVQIFDRFEEVLWRPRLAVVPRNAKLQENTPVKFTHAWMMFPELTQIDSLMPRYVIRSIYDVNPKFGYELCEATVRYPDPANVQADWKESIEAVMVKPVNRDGFAGAKCSILPDGKLVSVRDEGLQCIVRKIIPLRIPGY